MDNLYKIKIDREKWPSRILPGQILGRGKRELWRMAGLKRKKKWEKLEQRRRQGF